jgi:hypothetical protein
MSDRGEGFSWPWFFLTVVGTLYGIAAIVYAAKKGVPGGFWGKSLRISEWGLAIVVALWVAAHLTRNAAEKFEAALQEIKELSRTHAPTLAPTYIGLVSGVLFAVAGPVVAKWSPIAQWALPIVTPFFVFLGALTGESGWLKTRWTRVLVSTGILLVPAAIVLAGAVTTDWPHQFGLLRTSDKVLLIGIAVVYAGAVVVGALMIWRRGAGAFLAGLEPSVT